MNNVIERVLGTVAMVPKGEYSSEAYYEKLNTVLYNDSTYMAIKPSTGVLPTNTEYWQLIGGGVTREYVQGQVVDNLDSNETTKALSAKQGNKLNKSKATIYDTVADMKADTSLKTGMTAQTLGYYGVNDGGGATYKITNIESETDYQEELENELYATLIIKNNIINIKQFGAKSQIGTNTKTDIKNYILKYIEISNNKDFRINLYIPSGLYYCSPVEISTEKGFSIYGDEDFNQDYANGTIISSLNNNQDYILKIGNTSNYTKNWSLKNICFTSCDLTYDSTNDCFLFNYHNMKRVTDACLCLIYSCYGITDNLFFRCVNGKALNMSSCWENYFGLLNFRGISNHNSSVLCFDTRDTTLQDNANITACNFNKIMFEGIHGDLIELGATNRMSHCYFGEINIEDHALWGADVTYTTITDENISSIPNDINHKAIFANKGGSLNSIIDSLNINNFSVNYYEYNNEYYIFDNIIKCERDYAPVNMIINNINLVGMNKNCAIINQNNFKPYVDNSIIINNILNATSKDLYFDIAGFNYITCNSDIEGISKTPVTGVLQTLSNDITPFYKVSKKRYETAYGGLYYDDECQNKLKIAVKPFSGAQGTSTSYNNRSHYETLTTKNMIIRAKIPNGTTCRVAVVSPDRTVMYFDLVGTGEYKVYTLDNLTNFNVGDTISIITASASVGIDWYLDWFKFV